MSRSDLELRALQIEDLPAVALLHCAAFGDSVLTKLGPGAARRYYEWQLIGPHAVHPIGAFDGETLLGFCFSGRFHGAMSGFVKRNALYLALRVLLTPRLWRISILKNRARTIRGALLRRPGPPIEHVQPNPSDAWFSVLAIAVDPVRQRSGVGRLLLADAEREARARGYERLLLTVRTTNERALRFYEAQGWTRRPSDLEWSGILVKELA